METGTKAIVKVKSQSGNKEAIVLFIYLFNSSTLEGY